MVRRRLTIALALMALTALAIVLRIVGLNDGLWFDEILTLVWFVRPPLATIVSEYPSSNNHPLYSILGHLSVGAFGEHAWALRLPALIFGAATVPMLYWLGRQVTGRREALLAAMVLAVSYHHVWFSQNARGYTALAFFTTLSTGLLLACVRTGRWAFAAAYGAAVALGAYTHLTMILVAVAHAIVLGLGYWRRPARRGAVAIAASGVAIAAALTLVLYAPMAAAVYAFFSGPPLETASVATPSWAVREAIKGLRIGLGGVGALVVGVLFAAGLWSFWKQSRVVAALMLAPGVVTAAALVALQSPVRPRFFFLLCGLAILCVVRGTSLAAGAAGRAVPAVAGQRGALATGLVLLIVTASLASLPRTYRHPKQDYEGAMRFVDGISRPGVPVLTAGLAVYPYREYYGRPWQAVETESDLRRIVGVGGEAIVVYTFPEYTDAGLMRIVSRTCRPLRVFPATVAGGDIIVCAMPSIAAAGLR